MADSESDLEIDGLEIALETLCERHCSDGLCPKSKDYCSEFCELVEEYTGQWQVPLPQLKVLRTALCSFTKATAAFPDDCQHIQYVLSSLALSFFELMLFFSKEEFEEEPLKDILDSYQECYTRLLRHRNLYLQHVKQIIKAGGPWEHPVLKGILKETHMAPAEVEEYLSSELPVFLELRVRYLQACEKLQEALALAKGCLENHSTGKHLYFHQAYLTCLYKASLHEHLHKEMAEIDGRDAVEIICNTERVEKDELLLSLCKSFLSQQLRNGDMYYIWDLVFIWSRLHLRAHPLREGFLAECLQLASSATNVRAIFPFIKVVTAELGGDGVQVSVELCARALQLCAVQADSVTQSLVCKTIAFLLPLDLEICRACALLVFCQERSLEAYRTVCLLYMHPDQEPHPHNSPVRTSVRFHILQMLKERLCFDPEFWNLLTLRTRCLELISDNVMKAAVLNEMKIEEDEVEEEMDCMDEEPLASNGVNGAHAQSLSSCRCSEAAAEDQNLPEEQTPAVQTEQFVVPAAKELRKKRRWGRRLRKRNRSALDDEVDVGDDPEFKYNLKSSSTSSGKKPMYSLRRNHTVKENSSSATHPLNRKREYLSRCVKSQVLNRKGRKKRWLQGLPRLEQVHTVTEKKLKVKGKKRGRKPLQKLEFSYPENEITLVEEDAPTPSQNEPEQTGGAQRENTETPADGTWGRTRPPAPAVQADPELDGPPLTLSDCPIELLHSYCLKPKEPGDVKPEPLESGDLNGDAEQQRPPDPEDASAEVKSKRTWRDRLRRAQKYSHLTLNCSSCDKSYKGLNVLRHAIAHFKTGKLRCILCGKCFKQLHVAKKHVLDHSEDNDKEPDVPATNGIDGKVAAPSPTQQESQTPDSNEDAPEGKRGVKIKLSSLRREDRIIRNIRTLIKKRSVRQRSCEDPDSSTWKQLDIKEEQVVIKDGLVVVKYREETGGGGDGKPAAENGHSADTTYHLCPSESCDRVFLKIGSTLIRHTVRCHMTEEKVLEKTYVWAKHKCSLCLRPLQIFQHYKDHMKLHDTPLAFFCYHIECNQRFLTQQELREHVNSHQPFRPQCPFTDCEKLFASLQCLYDHEWRHYIPVPQKDELELGPSRPVEESSEAPWKQRVKVEEIWLQSKKVHKETPGPEHADVSRPRDLQEESRDPPGDGAVPDAPGAPETSVSPRLVDSSSTAMNGFESAVAAFRGATPTSPPATGAHKKRCQKRPVVLDPLNVKDLEDLSTLAEGVQQRIGEPLIAEHKSFKPEDPSYATFVRTPFIRPPPSTYLDESLLSMRKRRDTEEAPPPKTPSWSSSYVKKEQLAAKEKRVEEVKVRHRCDKCLASFSSVEDLKKHQDLNTCSSLFGFDSDDES